jgi:glycosyltransferase involved in cell wall biosynthesis
MMHQYLGQECEDHVAGTTDNVMSEEWKFHFHPLFTPKPSRYIPFANAGTLARLGKERGAQAVWCEHPYMAPTASSVARRLGVRWYLRSHNIESERFRELGKRWWTLMAKYERWAMRAASGTFFVTAEDADWAVRYYKLPREKAHVAPYGTPLKSMPAADANLKPGLAAQLGLDADKKWMYFLGAMGYEPNAIAVRHILDDVLPRLNDDTLVLLAGKGLPEELQEEVRATNGRVRYLGFLPDLHEFLLAQDVMLNPVLQGGGIKTKAVEALAYGKPVVSTASGASGLMREACGNALYVLPDGDWASFSAAAKEAAVKKPFVPASFYRTYHWGSIAQEIVAMLETEAN